MRSTKRKDGFNGFKATVLALVIACGSMHLGLFESSATDISKSLAKEQRIILSQTTPLSNEIKTLMSSQKVSLLIKTEEIEMESEVLPETNNNYNVTNTDNSNYTPPPSIKVEATGDAATVVDYALGMVGGAYVWGGTAYRATDCSGLVMLSYAQIGINLPHSAASQAYYGTSVSFNEMMPGDLIFYGYGSYNSIYHVAMYIGNGQIVEAQGTATGIVISNATACSGNIVAIKRLIN